MNSASLSFAAMSGHRGLRSLLAGICVLAGLVSSAWANERLMVAELKENEAIVIEYFSVAGTRSIARQYFIRGGAEKLLTAHRNQVEVRNLVPHVVSKQLIGDLVLSPEEVLGLESLLVFYAARIPGTSRTRDTIQVEFYRDGTRVGQFSYQDDTGFTQDKDSDETRARTRGKVNDLIMDSLLTFQQIDERIRAAEAGRR